MANRLACFIVLFCWVQLSLAQVFVIKGLVTDKATGKPVPGASVFLSSTSIGTAANASGLFELSHVPRGKFDLVVSSLGYETYAQSIVPDKLTGTLTIQLSQKANELADVVVGGFEKDGWTKWGKTFTDNFVGTSYEANSCNIKNYTVIKFRYSKSKQLLSAFADEPLDIENSYLGYTVHYKLEEFSVDFANHTIVFKGFPLFQEMNGNDRKQKRWAERRHDTYYGSILHFMRCLFVNKLIENGYNIRRVKLIPNKEKKRVKAIFSFYSGPDDDRLTAFESRLPKDTLEYYQDILKQDDAREVWMKDSLPGDSIAYATDSMTAVLNFNDYLSITYANKKEPFEYLQQMSLKPSFTGNITSRISLVNAKPIYVLYNGVYFEPDDMLSQGYWGWSEKVSTLLPFDYWP